jgi:hypothetical protein
MQDRQFRCATEPVMLFPRFILVAILLSIGTLFAQDAPLNPPDPLPDVPYPSAMDSKQVGQQSPVPNSDVVLNASFFDPLDVDIARWQKFLEQARQIVAAGEHSTIKEAKDDADRLSRIIPGAEAHLQALLARQKLQQELKDSKDCGLGQLMADWQNLKQFVDDERERMGPASAMSQMVEQQGAATFTMMGGAAGASLISAGASIMKRQMEMDADASELAGSNLGIIVSNCLAKQAQEKEAAAEKAFDKYKSQLAAANPVANQKAKEARELAKNGQYKDEGKIRELITTVFIVARANQLLGNEEGLKQQKEAQAAVTDFIQAFANDCMNQPVPQAAVYSLERINQVLPANADLSMCFNRLFESIGITGDMLPYRIRHCGRDLSGEWKMQVTRGTVNGAFGKLEGATDVPQLAMASSNTVSMPVLNSLTTNHYESAPAHIEASGRMGDNTASLGTMRAQGDFTVLVDQIIVSPGVLLHNEMKMNATIKQEGFSATPNGGGMSTYYPGRGGQSVDTPIAVINGNKPCDPSKDIFSYPSNL